MSRNKNSKPELQDEALTGPAGAFVDVVSDFTEASEAALLVQLLVAVGNVIGRSAYWQIGPAKHYLNLFAVLVGASSRARKGTSWAWIQSLLVEVDLEWLTSGRRTGIASGEALIHVVRDARPGRTPKEDDDPGVADKRLLIMESEFGGLLTRMARQGSTISPVMRDLWDGLDIMEVTAKGKPERATGAHGSMIGHITLDELRRNLTSSEMANGFGNRILWTYTERSQKLPFGGNLDSDTRNELVNEFRAVVEFARTVGQMEFNKEAAEYWCEIYALIEDGYGLSGAMTARAEAQMRRLACVYALLELSAEVRGHHLEAARAVVAYIEATVQYVFGSAIGNRTADRICEALKATSDGLTREQISDEVFSRHKSTFDIQEALELLRESGQAHCKTVPTEGRTAEQWFAGAAGAAK